MLPGIINIHQGPYGDKLRFCVNFMKQCPGKIAGINRWPNPPDELWVSLSDILKRIPESLPNGRSKRMFNTPLNFKNRNGC
jgi:hypothetical protein